MSRAAHLLVLLVTVGSVAFILRLVRRRELRVKYSLLWLFAGSVMVVEAAWPASLDMVSDWLGVAYAPSIFFMGAIALLFLVAIHFSWELSRLEERTRVLAEEVAMLRAAHGGSGSNGGAPVGGGSEGSAGERAPVADATGSGGAGPAGDTRPA